MITDAFDGHVKKYRPLRTNIIERIFRPRLTSAPPLTRIKTFMDEQKLTNSYIEKFFDTGKTLFDVRITYQEILKKLNELAAIKKAVDDLKLEDLQKSINESKTAIEKVKIPHPVANINNIVYVVSRGYFDWVKDTNDRIDFTPTVSGIYRFTLTRPIGDNFNIRDNPGGIGEEQTAIYTITQRLDANSTWIIWILSSIRVVRLRTEITHVIEFVAEINL